MKRSCRHVWSPWKELRSGIRPALPPATGRTVWIQSDAVQFCVRRCGARREEHIRCDLRTCQEGCLERHPLPGRELTLCSDFLVAHLTEWPDPGQTVAVQITELELETLRADPTAALAIFEARLDYSAVTAGDAGA